MADAAGRAAGQAPPGAAEGGLGEFVEWRRMHPRSTLVIVVPVLGAVVLYAMQSAIFDVDTASEFVWAFAEDAFGIAVTVVTMAFAWVRYLTTRFRIAEGKVQWRSGVVIHRSKDLSLERIQDVSITRPVIARLLGLGKVTISSAGSEGEISLEYLSVAGAERLAAALSGALHLHEVARGFGAPAAPAELLPTEPPPFDPTRVIDARITPPVPPVRELHRVDTGELVGAIWNRIWWAVAAALVVAIVSIVTGRWQLLLGLTGLAAATLPGGVLALLAVANLHVVVDETAVRATGGLTTISRSSNQRQRVQVVWGESEFMQRLRGRESVHYASADATVDPSGEAVRGLVALDVRGGTWVRIANELIGPLGTPFPDLRRKPAAATIAILLRSVLGTIVVTTPLGTAGAIAASMSELDGPGAGRAALVWAGLVVAGLTLAAYRGWRIRRVEGWWFDDRHLVVVSGLRRRRWLVAPAEKTQGVRITSGPLQRCLGLASVRVNLAPIDATLSPLVSDIRLDEAQELARRLVAAAARSDLPDGV